MNLLYNRWETIGLLLGSVVVDGGVDVVSFGSMLPDLVSSRTFMARSSLKGLRKRSSWYNISTKRKKTKYSRRSMFLDGLQSLVVLLQKSLFGRHKYVRKFRQQVKFQIGVLLRIVQLCWDKLQGSKFWVKKFILNKNSSIFNSNRKIYKKVLG